MSFDLLAWVSLAIIVCNLYMLSTSRLTGMIRGVAVQGFLLSILPLLLPNPAEPFHTVLLVILGMAIKGILIPRYLFRAIRDVRAIREVNPSVGYSLSAAYGIITSVFAFYLLRQIPFASVMVSPFHASVAIATAFIGIFLIVARRNVVSQIIGYLVFENSAFILAISIAAFQPLLVEMGVLLDMLVGVFIMVMAVHHIHTKHRTIGIESLERLTR
jgi:hydrogenase-4 component E